jgi:hypothetical protein
VATPTCVIDAMSVLPFTSCLIIGLFAAYNERVEFGCDEFADGELVESACGKPTYELNRNYPPHLSPPLYFTILCLSQKVKSSFGPWETMKPFCLINY